MYSGPALRCRGALRAAGLHLPASTARRAARLWRERALRAAARRKIRIRCSGYFSPCAAPALEIPGGTESLGKFRTPRPAFEFFGGVPVFLSGGLENPF